MSDDEKLAAKVEQIMVDIQRILTKMENRGTEDQILIFKHQNECANKNTFIKKDEIDKWIETYMRNQQKKVTNLAETVKSIAYLLGLGLLMLNYLK